MFDAITDVQGIEVGAADDPVGLTGCHVILCRDGAVVGCDVRGAAPGTRETDLCRPGSLVVRAHAVVLTGGSALGLDAATGVTSWLYERGIGYGTGVVPVPVVPAAVIFDLGLGAVVWPDSGMGRAAIERASGGAPGRGCVGAGMGATVGKVLGPENAMKSGVGTASGRIGAYTVGALVVVNALGDVVAPGSGRVLAGARDPETGEYGDAVAVLGASSSLREHGSNTTIGVVATDAPLDKMQVNHLARVAQDGLARTIRPVHTMFDGDTIFALATGDGTSAHVQEMVGLAAGVVTAVERAVVDAVESATAMGGLPGLYNPS